LKIINSILNTFPIFTDSKRQSVNVGFYVIAQQILNLKGLVILPLITKHLGVTEYGYYTLAIISSTFLMWLISMGLTSAQIRFLSGESNTNIINKAFSFSIFNVLFISSIIIIISILFNQIFSEIIFQNKSLGFFSVVVVVFSAFEALRLILFNYFRIIKKIKLYIGLELIMHSGALLFIIIFITFLKANIIHVFIIQASFSIFASISVFILLRKTFRFSSPSLLLIKSYYQYSIPLMVPTLMMWIITRFDKIILNSLLGVKAVGIYSANFNFPRLLEALFSGFSFIYEPILYGLWNSFDEDRLRKTFQSYITTALFFAFPMYSGLCILSKPIMRIFSNEEIASHTTSIIPFVGLSYIMYFFYGLGVIVFLFHKKTFVSSIFTIVGAIVNMSLNFLLIPILNITGASVSMLISYTIIASLSFFYSKKLFAYKLDIISFITILFSAVLMSLFVYISTFIWDKLFINIVIGICTYFLLYIIIKKIIENASKLAFL